ncbi:MAG: hypothetical protein ABJH06_07375 [Paraglaciecola sp.]|uniref:hypothetical protein n=1 Tax=Paraglaciecola sp. TaxID=1920173 RepID=UPI003265BD5C
MSNWYEPILFGFTLIAFVLGLTSLIMSFLPVKEGEDPMQSRVEYGFFGVSGLVLFIVFIYALVVA